ncbi:MAG: YkgJ family cysteine cluster protein [Acidobacteriia bacterium]|nr:YkgJ family cysteine cluster protein [Terriglobia bacterium]
MSDQNPTAKSILQDFPRMTSGDQFVFRCGRDLDCFTTCCHDVSIVLTPYDVLRLKKALGLDSSEFLERYTLPLLNAEQKFPLVILRMDPETKKCPFVSERGCGVYGDRPWACRMYPLGVATPKQATPADQPFHFVLREDLCHGHGCGGARSLGEWLSEQGVEEYEMMAAPFQEITLHEFWERGTALTPEQVAMFYMACYDLDRFRRFVFESRFLQLFEVDEARIEALRSDDEELLEFALLWLRFCIFGEKSMKMRGAVVEARRQAAAEPGTVVPQES